MWSIIILLLCGVLLVKQFMSSAPFVPTKRKDVSTLLEIVQRSNGKTFVDLGCGIGTTVAAVARAFPDKHCYGFEISPVVFVIAWMRCRALKNVHIHFGSFWSRDWAQFDILYLFWIPKTIARAEQRLKQKIRPGQTIVSYAFPVEYMRDALVEDVKKDDRLSLYVYQVK